MNYLECISKILDYINEHPDKDKILSDLRMTDTNEFQKIIVAVSDGETLLDNSDNVYLHEGDIESYGYISESDYDDKLDDIRKKITNVIDVVNETTMLEVAKAAILKEIKNIEECL